MIEEQKQVRENNAEEAVTKNEVGEFSGIKDVSGRGQNKEGKGNCLFSEDTWRNVVVVAMEVKTEICC